MTEYRVVVRRIVDVVYYIDAEDAEDAENNVFKGQFSHEQDSWADDIVSVEEVEK